MADCRGMDCRGIKKFDVIILGAGVLGTSVAYHLSKLGASVLVCEQEPYVAAHASGKNAGMIRQLYRNPQLSEWTRRSIQSWPDELRKHFVQTGSLILGRSMPDHSQDLFVEETIKTANGFQDALYCKTDGLLDSPSYVESIRQLAAKQNAKFSFKTKVSKITQKKDFEVFVEHSETPFVAKWLVNCAGAWINRVLLDSPQYQVAAQAFARHLFLLEGWSMEKFPHIDTGFYWDEVDSWYMRKWDKATRLVSICDRHPVESPELFLPDDTSKHQLADQLLKSLPQEALQLSIRNSWYCFRTYCEDLLPIWGIDPINPKLFWLASFGGFGMSSSFAATYDAALVISGKSTMNIPEFCPSRTRQNKKKIAVN